MEKVKEIRRINKLQRETQKSQTRKKKSGKAMEKLVFEIKDLKKQKTKPQHKQEALKQHPTLKHMKPKMHQTQSVQILNHQFMTLQQDSQAS